MGKFAGKLQRGYHSKQGVWGYRPIARRVYQGRKDSRINHAIYKYVPESESSENVCTHLIVREITLLLISYYKLCCQAEITIIIIKKQF